MKKKERKKVLNTATTRTCTNVYTCILVIIIKVRIIAQQHNS